MDTSNPSIGSSLPVKASIGSSLPVKASNHALAKPEQEKEKKPAQFEPLEPPPPGAPRSDPDFGVEIPWPGDDSPDRRLRNRQRTVMELMMIGFGASECAKLANVSRMTIWRWMKSDPQFQQATQIWQQRRCESARSMLIAGAESAANVVLHRVNKGDMKAALTILRASGATTPPQPGGAVAGARRGGSLEVRLRELLLSLTTTADPQLPAPQAALPAPQPAAPALPALQADQTQKQ